MGSCLTQVAVCGPAECTGAERAAAGCRSCRSGGWRVVDAAGEPLPGVQHVQTPEEAVALASSGGLRT